MANVRFCIYFSDWIIIWFILYKLKIVNYNPKFSVLIGLFDNFIKLTYDLIKKKISFERKYISLIIHIIIKIIEFSLLIDTPFTFPDLVFNLILFIIYVIWVIKVYYKEEFKISYITNIFNNTETNNLQYYNKINKIKLDKLNKEYSCDFDEINKKYINIINKNKYNFDQNKFNKKIKKYKNKRDKIIKDYEDIYRLVS